MPIMSWLFSKNSRLKDPAYFEELGECDHFCLACDHLDFDCEGDVIEDLLFLDAIFDDEW